MTAYEKICASRCEWCEKGNKAESHSFGDGPLHWVNTVVKGVVCGKYIDCPAPSPEAVIEELAGKLAALEAKHARELAAIRAEVEKLPHDAECASLEHITPWEIESLRHFRGTIGLTEAGEARLAELEREFSAGVKDCDCARGRAIKLAGGQ